MNRRELFQSLAALSALQACHPLKTLFLSREETERWFYSGIELAQEKTYGIAATWGSESQLYPVENVIHSVAYEPETNLKVFLPKSGAVAYYQIANGAFKTFRPAEGNYFYGHGVFDPERKVFYSTQSDISSDGPNEERRFNKGFIYVHSTEDFRIIDKFPSFGHDPHDVKIVNDELVVCNGGHQSNISFIDLKTRTLRKSWFINDEHLSAGHLEVLDDSNFVFVTGSYRQLYPCAIYSLNRDTGITKFPFPPGLDVLFRVQLLSVLHHQGSIYATCPHTDSLFIWDRSGSFIGAQHIPMVTSLAISKDLKGVVVGSGLKDQPLRLIKTLNGKIVMSTLDWGIRSTGSHALIIERT